LWPSRRQPLPADGAARTESGVGLFVVDGDAPGVTRTALATVDQTRKQARIELAGAPGRRVGDESKFDLVLDLAATLLAAEQVGGAGRCLEMTVDHVRRRVQFGRPIGTFQAVQHRAADMLLELESARSASAWATETASREPDGRSDDMALAAATAKVTCSEAFVFVATETIHLHGALGFTWDHDAHLYFKRARSSRLLFGDPRFHRERLFRRLGL
jgi:alkylation response protein AidB-like acyl-CoA dehydrogenase